MDAAAQTHVERLRLTSLTRRTPVHSPLRVGAGWCALVWALVCLTQACGSDLGAASSSGFTEQRPCQGVACDEEEASVPDSDDGRDAGAPTSPDEDPSTSDADPPEGDADSPEEEGDGDNPPDLATASVEASSLRLVLPYGRAGEAPAEGVVRLIERAGIATEGTLTLGVEGDFEVSGSQEALEADEVRTLTLRYTGPVDAATLARGALTWSIDESAGRVELAAVVGDAELPEVVRWESDDWGRRAVVPMPSAPYPHPNGPWDDSSVLIFVPDGFTGRDGVHLVAHMHGLRGVIPDTVLGQQILEQHALSGRDAVLIAPQGPDRAASNDFGKLNDPGGFARLASDVVALLTREGLAPWPELGEVVVTAHSGGYKPTASVLDVGGVPVKAAHLFDALYGREAIYEAYVGQGGMLRSSYTATGGTVDNNETLVATLTNNGTPVATTFTDQNLLDYAVLIHPSPFTHRGCVRGDRTFQRWLSGSGLARGALMPPELLQATLNERGRAVVRWRDDGGDQPARVRLEGSLDGQQWETLVETTETSAEVAARPWFRVSALGEGGATSLPSDRYGATGDEWLVVDGFDRTIDGSWRVPSHGFAAALGEALGTPFATASGEAVAEGSVNLSDYARVLWMLGDESQNDVTFDADERAAIEAYLGGGGRLLVTGSEVGYATAGRWLSDVLHARYIRDDAGTQVAEGYTFGVTYEEDYPDVLGGDTVLWRYSTGGAAAVGWNHQIIVVGFALETLGDDDRAAALQELGQWLE